MKNRFLLVLSLIMMLANCAEKPETEVLSTAEIPLHVAQEIPDTTVVISMLNYDKKTSLWTWNDRLYSGYAVSFYQDSVPSARVGILNGKKQHRSTQWHPDGHLKQVANYHEGKLHGEKKTWSADTAHILLAQLNYQAGKAHGEQKIWYPTGELFKKLHLNQGREEGIQQAFRKNGVLYANYEAKKGRIFGLKKAALCYGLEDENVQYAK